jgi:hypothetical protein
VEYIHILADEAKGLTTYELLHGKGSGIGGSICGAISYLSADSGVVHDGWINEKDEPLLIEILDASGRIDIGFDLEMKHWQLLFDLVDNLR